MPRGRRPRAPPSARPADERHEGGPVPLRARLHLDGLSFGGDAVGRDGGRVWFVPYGAPGEAVVAEATEVRSSFVRGRLLEVVSPSADRTEPRCRHFGTCGGCQWQHVTYGAQLREKSAALHGALRRVADVAIPDPEPSPSPWQYRVRAELHAEQNGRTVALGYRRSRSHEVVVPEECPVLAPPLEAAVLGLTRVAAIVPRAPRGRYELLLGDEGVALHVRAEAGEGMTAARWLGRVLDEVPGIVGCVVEDPGGIRYVLREGAVSRGGIRYSPGVFAQSHGGLAGRLADTVVELARPDRQAVLELHAGAGHFSVPLGRRARRLVAVEQNLQASEDARRNLEGVPARVQVIAGPVSAALPALLRRGEKFDVVVLDPPRTGARESLADLCDLGPRRIVYISCDPMTLARDLGDLRARGYRPAAVRAFDLFPQTFHLEAVCLLERAGWLPLLDR